MGFKFVEIFPFEKNKELKKNRNSDHFNEVIIFYELREIVMNAGMFTWSNSQRKPTLKNFGRILV
jgi:hypothetical protein